MASGRPVRSDLAADEENLGSFSREIAAARFHPNLATIYEIGHPSGGEIFVAAAIRTERRCSSFWTSSPSLLTAIQVVGG